MTMGESKEFCGGTHVHQTGDIASSRSSRRARGPRRATLGSCDGLGALALARRMENELGEAAAILRAGPFEVAARLEKLQTELRERDKDIGKLKAQIASGGSRDPLANRQQQASTGCWYTSGRGRCEDPARDADKLKARHGSWLLVLVGRRSRERSRWCAPVTPGAQDN